MTGWLVYDPKQDLPTPKLVDEYDPLDDFLLVPYDHMEIYDHVDQQLVLNFEMNNLDNGAN